MTAAAGSIGAAIATAGPGGTVVLRPGVYHEPLDLSVDVELVGEAGEPPVVLDVSQGAAVVVVAARVTLRDVHIRGGSRHRERG